MANERRSRQRGLLAALTLCWLPLAAPATASTDPPDPPPPPVGVGALERHFLLERVLVENASQFSPEIIIAASLLEEGRSYSERELADAASRIVRLPLVLDAEFSLRKGSDRDRFELVIRIEEARRWFFGVDSEITRWATEVSVSSLSTTDWVDGGSALLGRRFSIGRQGVLFLVLSGEDGLLTVGHSQHDLFGRGGLLTVSLSLSDCGGARRRADDESLGDEGCQTELFDLGLDPTFSAWSGTGAGARARFSLGLPIAGNHSLRVQATARSSESGLRRQAYSPSPTRFFDFAELRSQELGLAWVYDSTDDPLFPTRGLNLEAGVELFRLAADLEAVDLAPDAPAEPGTPPLAAEMSSTVYGATLLARRHWPVTERHTVSAGGRLFVGRSDIEEVPTEDGALLSGAADTWSASATAGHSMLLHLSRGERSWRELRWTSDAELFHRGTSPGYGQSENPLAGFRLSSGLVLRTTWGVFSFRLAYLDAEGR